MRKLEVVAIESGEYFTSPFTSGSTVDVTVTNVSAARASSVLTSEFVNTLPQNKYKLAFLQSDGTYNTPVY